MLDSASSPLRWILHCDGASRGNPGPASIGCVLYSEGDESALFEYGEAIGTTTNNEAEYRSLIEGVNRTLLYHEEHFTGKPLALTVKMDSELVVRQINGVYKVKNERLKSLFQQARANLAKCAKVTILHIPREQNRQADRIANEALDR